MPGGLRKRWVWTLLVLFITVPSFYVLAEPYEVQPGDSLWTISRLYGVPVMDIRNANGISDANLHPGQRLEITNPGSAGINYAPLKERIRAYLAGKEANYAVYFEDVITGQGFGINEHEWFHAASTYKLPAVLYLNELAARGKIEWQTKVAYVPDTDWQQGAGALQFFGQAEEGYTLRTLQTLAITLSDNIAHRMLVRHLGKDKIAEYMRGLGAEAAYPEGQAITTARDMGRYLRAALDLAAEYPAEGRRLLDDLANTVWDVGLSGLLPDGVTVAHKEGEISGVANDAGVVFGSRPYILIVLSRNQKDIDQGFRDIAAISRMVYDAQERLSIRRQASPSRG